MGNNKPLEEKLEVQNIQNTPTRRQGMAQAPNEKKWGKKHEEARTLGFMGFSSGDSRHLQKINKYKD